MTRQSKKPNRVEQVENRLDRVERNLEQITEAQLHNSNLLNRLIQVNADEHAQLRNEIRFLLTAVQGHTSQSTPPAHSAD